MILRLRINKSNKLQKNLDNNGYPYGSKDQSSLYPNVHTLDENDTCGDHSLPSSISVECMDGYRVSNVGYT